MMSNGPQAAELVRGRWWRTFGVTATVNVLAALSGPIVGLVALFTVTSASLDAINLIGSIVYVFTIPMAAVAVTLLYFDLVERPARSRKRSISAIVRSLGSRVADARSG